MEMLLVSLLNKMRRHFFTGVTSNQLRSFAVPSFDFVSLIFLLLSENSLESRVASYADSFFEFCSSRVLPHLYDSTILATKTYAIGKPLNSSPLLQRTAFIYIILIMLSRYLKQTILQSSKRKENDHLTLQIIQDKHEKIFGQ